jgi:UDP-2-acetamido-3-amino-2,3-dideoxy-glucuronate N-acetyltransferase
MSEKETVFIHESAFVDDGAVIGPGTKVWHFTHVREGAKVGSDCNIGQNVYVGPGVVIGNGVKIQNNVSVYEGVTLDDYVFLGPSVVFTNVINPRSEFPKKDQFMETHVGRGATVGANATVICGVTLGVSCFVAAGSVVTDDVSDYSLVMGIPARHVGWMCACGVRINFRNSDDKAICFACKRRYIKEDDIVRLQEGK